MPTTTKDTVTIFTITIHFVIPIHETEQNVQMPLMNIDVGVLISLANICLNT